MSVEKISTIERDLCLLLPHHRYLSTTLSGTTAMPVLPRPLKNSTAAASAILQRLSWANSETHFWRTRNDEKERNLTEIEPPTPMSTETSIIVATYLVALILGVLFVALPGKRSPPWAGCLRIPCGKCNDFYVPPTPVTHRYCQV
jgi:hypothetical protein